MQQNRHIYKKDKGLIELSIDSENDTLSIKSFDFRGNHLDSSLIKMDLEILPDLVDSLIELQNLPPTEKYN